MDLLIDEWIDVPLKWLEIIVDYLPEWPPAWISDGPPDWVIDIVEKYSPYLPQLPSSYIQELVQFGLPHFYVQQNVCEKAFDVGVLSLTLGSLWVSVLLLRRCLSTDARSITDRRVCEFCSAEKSEVLSEDLVHVEKRVDSLRTSCQNITKKLQGCLQGQGVDGPALEKRLRKLPEIQLSGCMAESSVMLGDQSLFGLILGICGNVQKLLGNELLEYESEVEKHVINKQMEVFESELPNILKQRKHLIKLTLDMDSARTRYQTAARHSIQNSTGKADVIKEEYEDASMKVEQCRDLLIGDMFSFISKEAEFANQLVSLVKIQAQYHKKALNILENYTHCMEEEIYKSQLRPVYGCMLEDHLMATERQIAWPLEFCICYLLEYGLAEEGLFRIAGSALEVKKLKSAFDANVSQFLDVSHYIKDPHAVAGALKLYLRELPTPLMTHKFYHEWMQTSKISDVETRIQVFGDIVHKLPVPYLNNLRYLMKFLNKLTTHQDATKMTAQNLAIVMAPNLMWDSTEGATLGMNMSLANTYSSIVDNLITYADIIFPGDVEFVLLSPMLKNSNNSYGSVPGSLPYYDNEFCPPNGDIESNSNLHPFEGSGHEWSSKTQASPVMGGSPKSLRRNKKPAPPAPAISKEKVLLSPEKPQLQRTLSSEKSYEKQAQPPEKIVVERKLSSSSIEKEKPVPIPSGRTNHVDKNHSNSVAIAEKPLIPEKPSFEKRTAVLNDANRTNASIPSYPVPAERHHIEKRQVQMSTIDKSQPTFVHLSEEAPLAMPEESKPVLSENIIPAVEYEPSESDEEQIYAPVRLRSQSTADRYDYYRPSWYGTEQEEIEEVEPEEPIKPLTEFSRTSKPREGFRPEQLRRISVEVLESLSTIQAEDMPELEDFVVETMAHVAIHKQDSLAFVEGMDEEAPPEDVDDTRQSSSIEVHQEILSPVIDQHILSPEIHQEIISVERHDTTSFPDPEKEILLSEPVKEILHPELHRVDFEETKPVHDVVLPSRTFREAHTPPLTAKQRLSDIFSKAEERIASSHETQLTETTKLKVSEIERPSSSEELIVIVPPTSINFVSPTPISKPLPESKPVLETKPFQEAKPELSSMAFDVLGNLSFLSTKTFPSTSHDDTSQMHSSDLLGSGKNDEQDFKDESIDDLGEVPNEENVLEELQSLESSVESVEEDYEFIRMPDEELEDEEEDISDFIEISDKALEEEKISEMVSQSHGSAEVSDMLAEPMDTSDDHVEEDLALTEPEPAMIEDTPLKDDENNQSISESQDFDIYKDRFNKNEDEAHFYPLSKMSDYSHHLEFEKFFRRETRSESYTDSEHWSRSEKSVSPERPKRRLSRNGRQASLESYSSYKEDERSSSPFHFLHHDTKSPFVLLAERPLSPVRSRAERPYSPPTVKSQSVPCTPPLRTDRRIREAGIGSQESVQSTTRSVDGWFAGTGEPVVRPRRARKPRTTQRSRPIRPSQPPKMPTEKPKRPPKPAFPSTVKPDTKLLEETSSAVENPPGDDVQFVEELEIELEPRISRGITSTRGVSIVPQVEQLLPSRESGAEMRTLGPLPSSPNAAPKRPPRPQPPPPPPPFKPRNVSSSEDTHL